MSKYKLINDQFKDKWINKPNNMGDVGDLQDITDELNNLLHERDEAREEISSIRNVLSHNGQAVGDGDHDYSIIEMIENLIKSRYYFVQKSDSLEQERDEARDILRKLLEIIPEPECHDFGHTKEEQHAFLEKCPVMARYDALIAQAKEAAK
jgi:hypothetical protein